VDETPRLFAVTVVMTSHPTRSDLSGMASALHRLGVEVIEAKLCAPEQGRREFRATFSSAATQASRVLGSLQKVINVIDVSLVDAADAQAPRRGRQQCSAHGNGSPLGRISPPASMPRGSTDHAPVNGQFANTTDSWAVHQASSVPRC
jgi:hypothetical protein